MSTLIERVARARNAIATAGPDACTVVSIHRVTLSEIDTLDRMEPDTWSLQRHVLDDADAPARHLLVATAYPTNSINTRIDVFSIFVPRPDLLPENRKRSP